MLTPPADLATLLANPPRGVIVRRGLDRVEVRLRKASWLRQWGMILSIGEVGSPERRSWWRWRAIALLSGSLLPFLWVLDAAYGVASDPQALILVLSVASAATLVSVCAAVAMLAALLDRLLSALRPCRVALSAQRLWSEEIGASCELPLDTIRWISARPRGRGPELGILHIQAQEANHRLLDGARTADLRWLASVVAAAIAQRKAALLAAGHDLSRPPPEAAALRAVARRASGPPRSGL